MNKVNNKNFESLNFSLRFLKKLLHIVAQSARVVSLGELIIAAFEDKFSFAVIRIKK